MATPTKQTTDQSDKTHEPPASSPTGPCSGEEGYDAKASAPTRHKRDPDENADNKKGGYGAG